MRLLYVEDDPGHAQLGVRNLTRAGIKTEWSRVETEADFLAALKPDLDIILSDFNMPQFGGLQALQLLNQRNWNIPFVIVSGTIGEEAAVQAMRLGASDYLRKERLDELAGTVIRALEQKRLRDDARRAERKVREQARLLDLARDAIIVKDFGSQRIVYWNKGAERLFGWTSEEAIGSRPEDLYSSDHLRHEQRRLLLEHGEHRREVTLSTKTGDEVTVFSSATLLRDEAGEPAQVMAIHTDVTEHRRLESQMFRAQRLESIGTLASGVAHDLSNVLSPVLMAVPLLRMDLPAASKEELISTIQTCAERGASIVRQVLTFARGGLSGLTLLNPLYLVKEVVKIVGGTFPKSIHLETDLPEKVWNLQGDSTQLQQVLLNLCVNARDAMPKGGKVTIKVENRIVEAGMKSSLHQLQPGPSVMFEVSDEGTGIPVALMEKIFDPFFTTKALGEGTGLGLATVSGIVKGHQGFIQLQNRPTGGCTFRVFLPALREEVAAQPVEDEAKYPLGHGELILVVDDEASIRSVSTAILEKHGYSILSAANGHDAIALTVENRGRLRLVITDLAMPLMDGLTLARTLRRLEPSLKILVSVGETEKSHTSDLEALRINPPLLKPYTAGKLLGAVSQILNE